MSSRDTPSLQPPRGMRDFYPEDMRLRQRIFDAWRRAAHAYGFEPYDACVVETLDLLKRKAGEEIVEQIYHFKDKSDRHLALRPEMTPTLARMIAARQGALSFPLKWATIAQCFRYERTTRGRKREHYQWNLDIVGEPGCLPEAEVLAAATAAIREMGLRDKDIVLDYSSRALLAELLSALGVGPEHHAAAFLALDKRGKIPDDQIRAILVVEGLPADAIDRVFAMLAVQSLDEAAGLLPGGEIPAVLQLREFETLLERYGLAPMARFNIGVVRGLAYYTGIVFEAFDAAGELRALFGGGRYDNLLADVGGAPMTGVGLGFGDVVIAELLKKRGIAGGAEPQADLTGVGYLAAGQQAAAAGVARQFRLAGRNVDLALGPEKAKKFFSRCAKAGYGHAVYIGPDDVAAGTVRVKDLATREEAVVRITAG